MTHQINIFLLLFGALQGWLLSLWFLKNQKKKISNLYFALILIVAGLQLTFKVVSKVWLMQKVHFAYSMSYDLPFLIGPLLYLYVLGRKENQFRAIHLLHFLPFVVKMALNFSGMFFNYSPLQFHPYTEATIQLISLGTYCFFALRLGNPLLKNFIYSVLLVETIVIITLAVKYVYFHQFPDVKLLFTVLTGLIYWISYKALSKPDLFLEIPSTPVISLSLKKTPKYAHSSLKPEEALRIETELHQLMTKQKLFLDSELTIDKLSATLKTSRHHLSQVLNEKLSKTYVDFVCELRLEEARARLSNRANNRFTIAAIALDSGFNSVSSFNEVFKKRYGTTPSKFRDQHLDQMTA